MKPWLSSWLRRKTPGTAIPPKFFLPVTPRPLTESESSVLQRLLLDAPSGYREQLDQLQVVGRCGCGICPTVFFMTHVEGVTDGERDVVSIAGQDEFGGLTAAVVTEVDGRLKQLEFYSVDGHEPYGPPDPATASRW